MLGLELMEQAVADARQNAANNNVANCEFYSGPAEDILQSVVDKAKFDNVVAVVDPPRAGLSMFASSRGSYLNKCMLLVAFERVVNVNN